MTDNERTIRGPAVWMSADEAEAVRGLVLTYLGGRFAAFALVRELGSIPADFLRQLATDLSVSGGGRIEIEVSRPDLFQCAFEALRRCAELHPDMVHSTQVLGACDTVLTTLGARTEKAR